MAQVLPAERGLRRVIGDGEAVRDGEVDGLDESDFLELYRQLVLLRTYDERSVVYHRQGRIGTYAIFWNHEAMQVGSSYALDARRLDLPELPRVGDRPAARDAAGDGALLVARPSGRLVEPARLQRRLDLRPDRDARSARGRARVGEEAARRADRGDRVLRRRRDLGGRVPRGRELRRRDARAADPLLQQQPVGDLDAAVRRRPPRRRSPTRRSATGCRACGSTAPTCSPSTRRRATRSRGRAPATGRRSSRRSRTAPRRTRPPTTRASTSTRSGSRRRGSTSASGRYEGYLRRLGLLDDETAERVKAEATELMRAGIAAAEAEPAGRSRADLRVRVRRPAADACGRAGLAELTLLEAVNDCLHTELARDDSVMVMGEDVGRAGGVFRATAGLRDTLRRRPLRRHAARRGRHPRHGGRALHGRLAAGLRDAVRRVLLSLPRPADQPRRPLPVAHARRDGVPARRPHAVRRRRARARAATTTRPRRTTCTRPA